MESSWSKPPLSRLQGAFLPKSRKAKPGLKAMGGWIQSWLGKTTSMHFILHLHCTASSFHFHFIAAISSLLFQFFNCLCLQIHTFFIHIWIFIWVLFYFKIRSMVDSARSLWPDHSRLSRPKSSPTSHGSPGQIAQILLLPGLTGSRYVMFPFRDDSMKFHLPWATSFKLYLQNRTVVELCELPYSDDKCSEIFKYEEKGGWIDYK